MYQLLEHCESSIEPTETAFLPYTATHPSLPLLCLCNRTPHTPRYSPSLLTSTHPHIHTPKHPHIHTSTHTHTHTAPSLNRVPHALLVDALGEIEVRRVDEEPGALQLAVEVRLVPELCLHGAGVVHGVLRHALVPG